MRLLHETHPEMVDYFQQEGINKRNRKMFGRLQPMLAENSVFVAIGALQQGGEFMELNYATGPPGTGDESQYHQYRSGLSEPWW